MHSGCTLTGVPLADSNVSVVNVGHPGNTFGSYVLHPSTPLPHQTSRSTLLPPLPSPPILTPHLGRYVHCTERLIPRTGDLYVLDAATILGSVGDAEKPP